MENLLREFLDCVVCYFDDIALFSNSWEHHIDLINKVCTIIEQTGFKVNPNMCHWSKQEVELLGYLITLDRLKPLHSKISAILAMKNPEKQLHVLTPLTNLLSTTKYVWSSEQDIAFLHMKSLVIKDTFLVFPDPNRQFLIETDASDYQLGAVIKQCNDKLK